MIAAAASSQRPRLEAAGPQPALLSVRAVSTLTSLSVATLYRKVAAKTFPAPVRIGTRCTRFRAAEVHAWIEQQ